MKRLSLVEVLWDDAHNCDCGEWIGNDDERLAEKHTMPVNTVGFVVREYKSAIVVAGTVNFTPEGEINQLAGTMRIPRDMIRKVIRLK